MKRVFAMILVVCIVTSMTVPAFALDGMESASTEDKMYVDTTVITDLTVQEMQLYTKYASPLSDTHTKLSLLKDATIKDFATVDCNHTEFEIANISEFFPECSEMKSVFQMGDLLYVEYVAKNGFKVYAAYSDNGLDNVVIYCEATDTAVFMSGDKQIKYENFRNNMECLTVQNDTEILPIDTVESVVDTYQTSRNSSATIADFEDEDDILDNLCNELPPINRFNNFTRFSSELNKNVSVRVKNFRGNYEIIKANYRDFGIGTAITLIGAYLGIPLSGAEYALTGLGILWSANGAIRSNVKLYNLVDVSYTYSKTGLVYDSTIYDDYVYVVQYTSEGRFTGGYNNEGVFDWVGVGSSATEGVSDSDVADEAIDDYDWDLALNGVCSSFNTTGFW